jgi:hypothetical protein
VSGPQALTEKAWQSRVVDYARLRGWQSYHTYDSRRSEPGFPDLVLVREGRCVVAELKRDDGRVTSAQQRWLSAFRSVRAVEVHVWRPVDWSQVQAVLR